MLHFFQKATAILHLLGLLALEALESPVVSHDRALDGWEEEVIFRGFPDLSSLIDTSQRGRQDAHEIRNPSPCHLLSLSPRLINLTAVQDAQEMVGKEKGNNDEISTD